MRKVTVFSGGAECRMKVVGRLFSPWASELEPAWEQAQQAASGKKIVVDLGGMTFIDSNGKAIRMNMTGQGAKLVARGVHNERIVEELMSRARAAGAARIIGSGGSHGYHRSIWWTCSGGWSSCRSQEPGLFIREAA